MPIVASFRRLAASAKRISGTAVTEPAAAVGLLEPGKPDESGRKEERGFDGKADAAVDGNFLAHGAVSGKAETEDQRDPGQTAKLDRQHRDPAGGNGDGNPLGAPKRLGKEDHAKQNADQWIDEIAEARLGHPLGRDRPDIDKPVGRNQGRGDGKITEPAERQRAAKLIPAPGERDEKDRRRQAPENPVREHLDRPDMIEQPEIERQPTPDEVGPETAKQAKAKF